MKRVWDKERLEFIQTNFPAHVAPLMGITGGKRRADGDNAQGPRRKRARKTKQHDETDLQSVRVTVSKLLPA